MTKGKDILGIFLALLLSGSAYGADLFYLINKDGKCHANILNIDSKKNRILFSSSVCPKNVIVESKTIYYSIGEKLCVRSLGATNGFEKCLANMPDPEMRLWIDPKTKRPKGIYTKEIEQGKYKVIKDADGDGQFVFDFEGKQFQTSGFGGPYIAIAVELIDGKWRRFEIAATTGGACESLGAVALDSFHEMEKGAGIDVNKLATQMICAGGTLHCELNTPALLSLFKAEWLGKIAVDNTKSIYFPTDFGGTMHAFGPIYFCNEPCQKPRKISEKFGNQIALSIKGKYLLVAEEYTNKNPMIFDLVTEKTVFKFPGASSAVWWP